MIVIRGGDVLTPSGWAQTDVGIDGTRVVEVGPGLKGSMEIDAHGCFVGPGFVDLHTHLREPGQTWKEDIASGSAAAIAGGFTAITAMPNTDPPMDTRKVVESVLSIAATVDLIDVIPSAALTLGRSGALVTDVEDLYENGVRLFTDDGDSVTHAEVLSEVMERIAHLPGAFVAQHAEDVTMTGGGHMHAGDISRRLGIGGMPWEAETDVVRRDIEIAAKTGARYHCQHVSARATIEVIAAAKTAGLPVTAEVTPHHLTFDDDAVRSLDPNFKMYPPLRAIGDREALIAALASGVIDIVATDHAPHTPQEKSAPFTEAPRGVIGLETAAAAVWEAIPDRDRFFECLSTGPARLLGLEDHGRMVEPGVTANLVVFDPGARWVPTSFVSKAANSPYRGREMRGRVSATMQRGRVAHSGEAA